jgi:hypothetical protein
VNVHLLDFLSQQENLHIKNDPHPACGAHGPAAGSGAGAPSRS